LSATILSPTPALDRVVEPDRDGAAAGIEVAGPQRSDHLRSGIERHELDGEAFGGEIALASAMKNGASLLAPTYRHARSRPVTHPEEPMQRQHRQGGK